MERVGVDIWALTTQNEPSMGMWVKVEFVLFSQSQTLIFDIRNSDWFNFANCAKSQTGMRTDSPQGIC